MRGFKEWGGYELCAPLFRDVVKARAMCGVRVAHEMGCTGSAIGSSPLRGRAKKSGDSLRFKPSALPMHTASAASFMQ
jgi:hypothetical protein